LCLIYTHASRSGEARKEIDMNAFYVQKANEIFPIYGAGCLDEAKAFVLPEDHSRIVETSEDVYMNPATGSVDFASGWNDLSEVVKVTYNAKTESWEDA
jgi:hypothetical protein